MPCIDFFQSNPSIARVCERLNACEATLQATLASPDVDSMKSRQLIATLQDDIRIIGNRLDGMRADEKRATAGAVE